MREHREKSKGSQKPILNAIKDLKNVDLLTSAEVYRNQKKNFPVMPWFQSTHGFITRNFNSPPLLFFLVKCEEALTWFTPTLSHLIVRRHECSV